MRYILALDQGTTSSRSIIYNERLEVVASAQMEFTQHFPQPGWVEHDAMEIWESVLSTAREAIAKAGIKPTEIASVGITNQRVTVVVWYRKTGLPVHRAIVWQDRRTGEAMQALREAGREALIQQRSGLLLDPYFSASKMRWILQEIPDGQARAASGELAAGTIDSWLIFKLTSGAAHVTDVSNAAVTGLMYADASGWDDSILTRLDIPIDSMPRLVDSSGPIAPATALEGAPMICGLVGDQQASLIGQSCVEPGPAKITFGTGGMLDMVVGPQRPSFAGRSSNGSFPIVTWLRGDELVWGLEAIMLSAGTNVEWLRDDLGIIDTVADSHTVASACATSDGVVYVPALLGLGTPRWDFGARGALLGLTRGSGRPQIVRAVLEGVAHRGADLVEAVEADAGSSIATLRVDGGMSANPTFVQALANATGRPVEVSPVLEATTLGAAYLAGLAIGTWSGWSDIASVWRPRTVVEPSGTLDRAQWARAVDRAAAWIPDLSALDF